MARQIKKGLLFWAIAVCFAFSGCMQDLYNATTLENGQTCKYFVIEEGDKSYLHSVDLMSASRDDIVEIESDDVTIPAAVGEIKSAENAAKAAAELLNKTYEKWTFEDNNLGVGYNKNADIWFAHGLAEDRNHGADLLGRVVFDAKIGEVLVLTRTKPED